MNLFLLPYTWHRHVAMGFWCAGAALLAWWAVLVFVITASPSWTQVWDGLLLLSMVSAAVASASVLGESNLYRRALWGRIWRTGLTFVVTALLVGLWSAFWEKVLAGMVFAALSEDAGDASLVSLRYRIGAFVGAGLATAFMPLALRRFRGTLNHFLGGLASGLAASATWTVMNTTIGSDLYASGAAMALCWGFVFGLTVWAVPDSLYAGWFRVLSGDRRGRRIPVDAPDGAPKERFVGHFPRGLDLFLAAERGVTELHLSLAVDDKQRYKARGLSLMPTRVKRFLERIDLRYDPSRPAPLETRIYSGDRIQLGEKKQKSELEFIMLPREEQ